MHNTLTIRRFLGYMNAAWRPLLLLVVLPANGLYEDERVKEYEARGHNWPPGDDEFTPNTAGWRDVLRKRIRQLEHFDSGTDGTDKWNGYLMTVYQAVLSRNFTESGWGLTRAPQYLVDELRKSLHVGLVSNPGLEPDGEEEGFPLFVEQQDLNERVLQELKPIHEAWSGVPLTPELAYGLRVYRMGATLDMHLDRSGTHVISSILHVDHDPVGDPWPIVIEDFHGNTNEVILESGDMLLYESSKCMHGRPQSFNGAWYSSVFVHYSPVGWDEDKVIKDVACRIPPEWELTKPPDDDLEKLIVHGTAMLEPGCEHNWCGLKDSVKWSGPGEFGEVLSAGGIATLDISVDAQRKSDEL